MGGMLLNKLNQNYLWKSITGRQPTQNNKYTKTLIDLFKSIFSDLICSPDNYQIGSKEPH